MNLNAIKGNAQYCRVSYSSLNDQNTAYMQ